MRLVPRPRARVIDRAPAQAGACLLLLLSAFEVSAADLPEELPPATDLNASPTLSYRGQANGYSHGVRVTFRVPRMQLFEQFFSGSGLDPFYCALEQEQDGAWVEVVSPAFCQPFDPGWAEVGGLQPDTRYEFRVVLYQDGGDGNQEYIRMSPPSEVVAVSTLATGTPDLTSTCRLAFGDGPSDGTVPLAWQLEPDAGTVEEFELQRTEQPGGPWETVATVKPDAETVSQKYRDEGLSTEQDYYYRVRAVYANGSTSGWSQVVKERATRDRDWCDTDRAAHDGAADAVGSEEWPTTPGAAGGGSGGSSGAATGGAGDAPGTGGAGVGAVGVGGAGAAAVGGASGGGLPLAGAAGGPSASPGSTDAGSDDGCACHLPGGRSGGNGTGWLALLLLGLVVGRRRAFRGWLGASDRAW